MHEKWIYGIYRSKFSLEDTHLEFHIAEKEKHFMREEEVDLAQSYDC